MQQKKQCKKNVIMCIVGSFLEYVLAAIPIDNVWTL